MNLYVSLINDTIDYIEENISEQMMISDISKKFCISEYHFNRLFKAIVGKSLKQYILGRKLTRALKRLNTSKDSIVDIAYDLGFEYPEVFSRAFKKQFGVSPTVYRKEKMKVDLLNKASIVERDMVNFQGILTLKGKCIYLEDICLEGDSVEVDTKSSDFEPILKNAGEDFIFVSQRMEYLEQERFYSVVNCHGDDSGVYTVFFGKELKMNVSQNRFKTRLVPAGYYASFSYHGDMFDMRATFIDDLYRWIMVKEVELDSNGIGMINVYDKDYIENQDVKILVPIKKQNR